MIIIDLTVPSMSATSVTHSEREKGLFDKNEENGKVIEQSSSCIFILFI